MPEGSFGFDAGERGRLERDALLHAFAAGVDDAEGAGIRIAGDLLVLHPGVVLALRVAVDVVLVRADLPERLHASQRALEEALVGEGLALVERDTVLAGVIGIEVAGLRGTAWDLWARDPGTGRERLAQRALGEMADLIDPEELRRRQRVDEAVAALEREFDAGGDG